ncbi:glycosyltransferase [Leptobacterium flavescens]|uniref:Glycosyltransferase n=1 Tax=Leptobacterium flavescens TaxID=472055 RepID=A0A6P0UEY3_9FLAO|nr:glycosyltransferase [Leptobacterium flavescens]NER11824.1 glycosyltransferase [Leptobacterium flavescens]
MKLINNLTITNLLIDTAHKKLSIVIPLYNLEEYISRCLDSLLNQNIPEEDYEIVIINDGSTDSGPCLVNNYLQKHSHIQIHNQSNAGVAEARNRGLEFASGEYIYFIDGDDYLLPGVLGYILNSLDRYELDILGFKSKVTSSGTDYSSDTGKVCLNSLEVVNGQRFIETIDFRNEIWWYVVRKDFLMETGIKFFKNTSLDDTIFTTQILLKAERTAFIPMDAHRYFVRPGSIMNNTNPRRYIKLIEDFEFTALKLHEALRDHPEISDKCREKLIERKQAFVFFMLVRILKSEMTITEVKNAFERMKKINAYPLDAFPAEGYNRFVYGSITWVFNRQQLYLLLFRLINPFFRLKNYLLGS